VLRPGVTGALVWGAYVWMGTMFLLLVLLVAGDVARLLGLGVARFALEAPLDPTRRQFLARATSAGTALGGLALGFAALRAGLAPPRLEQVRVALRRLPRALSGTTIVQISDLHVGPTIGRAFVEDVVARANALAPDVVAITGDLVDGSVADLADAVAPLAQLRARHGVFFVTGNHEYYSGASAWARHLATLGVRVLRNERVTIGAGADSFDLAGVDDHSARRYHPRHGPDLTVALAGRDPARECVLLAHQPKAVHDASRHGVGLVLCGHTHGGQIWPFGFVVRLTQPYIAGLARHDETTQIYVSRGTGYWGPPMRLRKPGELTRIELVTA
jgi:hypothetical protein